MHLQDQLEQERENVATERRAKELEAEAKDRAFALVRMFTEAEAQVQAAVKAGSLVISPSSLIGDGKPFNDSSPSPTKRADPLEIP